jgi:hypothetical protein
MGGRINPGLRHPHLRLRQRAFYPWVPDVAGSLFGPRYGSPNQSIRRTKGDPLIEKTTHHCELVNLKIAKALGLTIPDRTTS